MKVLISLSLVVFSMSIIICSCGGGAGKVPNSDSSNATEKIINTGGTGNDSTNENGSNLIASNDCLTCHQIDQKGFGPSYRQIANRYEMNNGNIENLASRVITGGKGLWGQNAMIPHPNVTTPQAEKMIRYILSLRDTTKAK